MWLQEHGAKQGLQQTIIIEDGEAKMRDSDPGIIGRDKATKGFAMQVENLILRAAEKSLKYMAWQWVGRRGG